MFNIIVLCQIYLVHSFVLTSLIGDAAFHAAGSSTQLVDLPNRSTLYSADVGELQVNLVLFRIFIMRMCLIICTFEGHFGIRIEVVWTLSLCVA